MFVSVFLFVKCHQVVLKLGSNFSFSMRNLVTFGSKTLNGFHPFLGCYVDSCSSFCTVTEGSSGGTEDEMK